MSAPVVSSLLPSIPVAVKKKRVLLVDTSRPKRDLRAETMRKLGMEVDCAADVAEARCWWRADLYDLVLINVQEAVGPRDKFCDDMRRVTPGQQIMFLVGKPEYLAAAPNGSAESLAETAEPIVPLDPKPWLSAGSSECGGRWGILEACRRISAVRNVSQARAQAIRNRPLPARDSEISQSRRTRERELFVQLIPENTI
jgi:CheY-like chemotaxis protein